MATLTVTERIRLGIVRPELLAHLLWLKDAALEQLGFVIVVAQDGGTRSLERQAALYADSIAQGGGELAYPVGKPGSSRHNYGAAFDVWIVAGGSAADGTGTEDDYKALATLAESLPEDPGLTAGYFFAARGLATHSDPYHFQLMEPLEVSKQRWAKLRSRFFAGVAIAGAAIGFVWANRAS